MRGSILGEINRPLPLPDIPARLSARLAPRYRLERELGHGGMAVVYLAHDPRHDRPVALKVLRPELAASLGGDRFLREIHIAARLQHPHILPVLDSGEVPAGADGPLLLWYTMPLVEGESLRDRLRRQGQQPLGDALRWTVELADALAYAHAHGIVHRDLKPENVLLSRRGGDDDPAAPPHALLADFGVARALNAGGTDRITEPGLALGTPAYMSPEQAMGDAALDARSDLYSLGCVLYELLTGEPPYTGPTAQAIIAKSLNDPVPSARRLRDTVPPAVDAVVQRLLARSPADRFASANELVSALAAAPSTTAAAAPPATDRVSSRRPALLAGLALVVLAIGAVAVLARRGHRSDAALDPTAIAVLPFRVTAPDRSLDYLGEGIVDLLAVKLDGAAGPHAVPPRQLLGALGYRPGMAVSAEAGEVAARRAGAGLVLDGSLVRSGAGVELSATLRPTAGSGAPVRASAAGSLDSLPVLVDRLAAQLLAGQGGGTAVLGQLSSSRAIAEYLQGKAAQRRGKYREAVGHFGAALDLDSTFALAALDALAASGRTDDRATIERARRLGWASRARLTPKGQALLRAWLGPNYPAPSSMLLELSAWAAATAAAPDVGEAWFELGDRQLHFGALNDVPQAAQRSEGNFRRALELEPDYVMPLEHLLQAKLHLDDTVEVRTLARRWTAQDTASGDRADYIRWRLAVALGDSATVRSQRARLDRWPDESVDWLAGAAQSEAAGLGDVALGLAERRRRAVDGPPVRDAQLWLHDWALNAGRPAAGLALLDSLARGAPYPQWSRLRKIDDALFGEGDTAAAAAAARSLAAEPLAPAPRTSGSSPAAAARAETACRLGLWATRTGDGSGVQHRWRELRSLRVAGLDGFNDDDRTVCADLLEAWLAVRQGRPEARALLDRADSIYLHSDILQDWRGTNLVTARLREALGDSAGARRAAARLPVELPVSPLYQSSYLQAQAGLDLSAGDTAAAVRALRRYLALRADPEPGLRAQRDSARARLAELVGR